MDNLKLPAYPHYDWDQLENGKIIYRLIPGFTKLESASLMALQGMLSNSLTLDQGIQPFHTMEPQALGQLAVRYAAATLEEANK